MRRAIPSLVATVIGLVALASFKSSPGLPGKSASAHSVTSRGPAATAPPTTGGSAPTSGAGPTTNPSAPVGPTTPPTAAGTTRTVTGDPFDNPYGTVQVQVTLQGSRITNVTPLQMPTDRQRSAEISQQAAPLLLQEVLQAQSAQIDLIGGASYTSQAYAQSLQSALDKAH